MMLNKSDLKKLFFMKLKFAMTSSVATFFDFCIYSFFVFFIFSQDGNTANANQMAISSVIGASVGMIINFFLQKKFVFQLKRKLYIALFFSILVSLGGIAMDGIIVGTLGQLAIFKGAEILKLGPKFIAKGVIFFYNFYMKRFVFEKQFIEKS